MTHAAEVLVDFKRNDIINQVLPVLYWVLNIYLEKKKRDAFFPRYLWDVLRL